MELTTQQVLDYAMAIIENYDTEPIKEPRVGDELRLALFNAGDGEDARDIFQKTVGRLYEHLAISIKVYEDDPGGMIISCREEFGHSDYDDGTVFVYQAEAGVIVFSHGLWETLLLYLYSSIE